jgi:plasmid stabilization system protein ParE
MKYSFLEPARDELEEAVARYEGEREGLGEEFAREVENTIQRIVKLPEAWTPLAPGIRRCRTNRFPYGLVYTVRDEEIVIVAVMYLRRKPGYWQDQLPE